MSAAAEINFSSSSLRCGLFLAISNTLQIHLTLFLLNFIDNAVDQPFCTCIIYCTWSGHAGISHIYNALNISSSQTVDFHLLRRNAKQASLLSILILSPTTERDKPSLYIVGSVLCQWSYIVDLSYASRIFPRYFLPLKIQRMYREKYKFIKQRIAH